MRYWEPFIHPQIAKAMDAQMAKALAPWLALAIGAWLAPTCGTWLVVAWGRLATAVGGRTLLPPTKEGPPTYVVSPSKHAVWPRISSLAVYTIAFKLAAS